MEKATGFLVGVLVAAADVCTTVELVLETMVVPGGKLSETITLPTSSVTKLAVAEVSVATPIVVEPSVKVAPPISHGPSVRRKTMFSRFAKKSPDFSCMNNFRIVQGTKLAT